MVLHEDSTLVWYLSESNQEGGVLLKDAPEMIAAGQVDIIGYKTYDRHAKPILFIHINPCRIIL